jgi:hypothetical protein
VSKLQLLKKKIEIKRQETLSKETEEKQQADS